jgi:hypothetical protein
MSLPTVDVKPRISAEPAEALIEEARRRHRRRRHMVLGGLALLLIGAAIAAAVMTGGSSPPRSAPPAGNGPRLAGPPPGRVAPLELAGSLAVGPGEKLYVADQAQHEVLVRQSDGNFRVVAGDGKDGFAGDGGPATKAELSDVSDLAFNAHGDLYIADGGRVRVVNRAGTIRTVAGNGGVLGEVVNGTPALSAPLGPAVSIALSPTGELYIATTSQLFRLTPGGRLRTVRAVVTSGLGQHGPLDSFGQIVVGDHGDIYASSIYRGWAVYEIAPNGVATYLGYARRDGGADASLAPGPHGTVEAETGSTIMRVVGNELMTAYAFDHVAGTDWFTLNYFAVAPNGTVYADDLGSPAFQPVQQLVEVHHGHQTVLWHHPNRK